MLSSVIQQQNLTEYWWEGSTSTAISPTSASDVVGQHNKIGDINFGATLVLGVGIPAVSSKVQRCGVPKSKSTNVKVKVKFTLEHAMKAQRCSKVIALFFL